MKFNPPFSKNVNGIFIHLAIAIGTLMIIGIVYFYVYLPNHTNHGESITVPDLKGMKLEEIQSFLADHDLRYQVDDSSYSEELPPSTVLLQYPKGGAKVKENRIIYITVNQINPPTVPLPDLVDRSRINAEVVLKSNELRRGRIILEPSPFLNLVKEMLYRGQPVKAGTRIPKGSIIDLVVGDGNGPADFVIGNLVGDPYDRALFKLSGWNLHLGNVQIPEGVDTTGIQAIVFKQSPLPGDSVRVGDPVDIWIAPKGYEEPEEGEIPEENNH